MLPAPEEFEESLHKSLKGRVFEESLQYPLNPEWFSVRALRCSGLDTSCHSWLKWNKQCSSLPTAVLFYFISPILFWHSAMRINKRIWPTGRERSMRKAIVMVFRPLKLQCGTRDPPVHSGGGRLHEEAKWPLDSYFPRDMLYFIWVLLCSPLKKQSQGVQLSLLWKLLVQPCLGFGGLENLF